MKAEHVLLACLVVVSLALAFSAVSTIALLLRLKRHEHDAWLSLESPMPTLDWAKHLRQSNAIMMFLKNRAFRSLRDERSARLGELVVRTNRILLGIMALASVIAGYIIWFVKP